MGHTRETRGKTMKKVLFATTALVLSAGFASAEVALSGDGRMGLIYDGNDAQFGSRVRAKFTLTGETDAGLSFGGAFRVDQQDNSGGKASDGTAGAVWISGSFGKLSMGDVVSASEAAIGDLYDVGYTEGTFGGDLEEISYLTGDGANTDQGPNILYEYTYNNFSFYGSATDASDNAWPGAYGTDDPAYNEETGQWDAVDGDADSRIAWSVAGAYEGEFTNGTYKVGLGYAKHDEAKELVLGGEFTYNNFMAKAIYADYSNRNDISFQIEGEPDRFLSSSDYEYDRAYGLSLGYQYNAFLFKGYYRRDEFNAITAGYDDTSADTWGIGADYDLGGGAVLAGGIVDSDWASDTVADFGIRFKF